MTQYLNRSFLVQKFSLWDFFIIISRRQQPKNSYISIEKVTIDLEGPFYPNLLNRREKIGLLHWSESLIYIFSTQLQKLMLWEWERIQVTESRMDYMSCVHCEARHWCELSFLLVTEKQDVGVRYMKLLNIYVHKTAKNFPD